MIKTVAQESFLKKTINNPEIIDAFIYCKTFLISYVNYHTLLAFYIELIEPIQVHSKERNKLLPIFYTNLNIYIAYIRKEVFEMNKRNKSMDK